MNEVPLVVRMVAVERLDVCSVSPLVVYHVFSSHPWIQDDVCTPFQRVIYSVVARGYWLAAG